jgi:hypothetical protein
MKKVIKLKESDLKNIVKRIISEQSMGANDQEVVRQLEEFVNRRVKELQNQILNNFNISIQGTSMNDMSVNFLGYSVKLEPTANQYTLEYNFPSKSKIEAGSFPLSGLIPEIESVPDFKTLLDRQPSVRTQLENESIEVFVFSLPGAKFKFNVFGEKNDKSITKGGGLLVNLGQETPFGNFYTKNSLYVRLQKGVYGGLETANIEIRLAEFFVKGPKSDGNVKYPIRVATTGGGTPQTIEIKLDLVDVFVFDTTNFIDEEKTMSVIDSFVGKIENGIRQAGETFKNHITNSKPTILGYASIDAPSTEKITGKFKGCSGLRLREDYNLCLSTARANRISEILNGKLEKTGITVGAKGMGETKQFNGIGYTKEKPTTTDQTAPNRRFVLTTIPPFKVTIK